MENNGGFCVEIQKKYTVRFNVKKGFYFSTKQNRMYYNDESSPPNTRYTKVKRKSKITITLPTQIKHEAK